MKYIPYGKINFKVIRDQNYVYVDKTKYLEKLESPMQNSSLIYLRPRRFGKSLFTNMMEYYYSIDTADEFESLFKGLYVYDHPTPNKNNYYVLKFDFSGMNLNGKDIVSEGEKLFYNNVVRNIKIFVNRYNLNIQVNGDTVPDVMKNFLEIGRAHD